MACALLLGHRPRLLGKEILWDCFIADRGLIHCSHQPHEAKLHVFFKNTLDTRLYNAVRDLHTFSCISNLAFQTTRKLSPAIYNEMMISILYRLTCLSFERSPLQEVIRTGLLAFSSTIFMQRHYMEQSYDNLSNLYFKALFRLLEYIVVDIPGPILLWLTMFSYVVAPRLPSPTDSRNIWLDNAVLRSGVASWPEAREILRSIMWVDFVHDRLGKQNLEAAITRLEKAARCDHVEC